MLQYRLHLLTKVDHFDTTSVSISHRFSRGAGHGLRRDAHSDTDSHSAARRGASDGHNGASGRSYGDGFAAAYSDLGPQYAHQVAKRRYRYN
jgi:hypothetical protein